MTVKINLMMSRHHSGLSCFVPFTSVLFKIVLNLLLEKKKHLAGKLDIKIFDISGFFFHKYVAKKSTVKILFL